MRASEFTTKDYITLGLAAWGAVLSTILAVRQVWRDRPGVRVLVEPLVAQPHDGNEFRDYWRVRVINVRQRPIELMQVGFHMRKRRLRNLLAERETIKGEASDPLPITLKDGERATYYFERDGHGHGGLGRLSAVWVRDSLDRTYLGRYRPHSPKQLLRRFNWWLYTKRRNRRARRRQRRSTD